MFIRCVSLSVVTKEVLQCLIERFFYYGMPDTHFQSVGKVMKLASHDTPRVARVIIVRINMMCDGYILNTAKFDTTISCLNYSHALERKERDNKRKDNLRRLLASSANIGVRDLLTKEI
jgi:hypothetical protein